MKRLIAGILGLLTMSCFIIGCATLPPEQCQFEKIYELPDTTKDTIYSKTLAWMAETSNASKTVIELQDKENGKIVGHGMTAFTSVIIPVPVKYTLVVDIKDNKTRLTYKDLIGMWGEFHDQPRPLNKKGNVNAVKEKLGILSDQYFEYMTTRQKDW